MTCPCRDCNNRSATCHGTCKAYKEWSIKDKKIKREKFITNSINYMIDKEIIDKCLKKKRKKER